MLTSTINIEIRNEMGSGSCNRIRSGGYIPGIIYGSHINPQKIEVDKKEIDQIIRNYGTTVFIDFSINGIKRIAMIKEIQRDPITNEMIHMDLQEISKGEIVHVTVPIQLKGREKIQSKDGVIQQQLRELEVECLPQYIPQSVEVDVSILKPGYPLRIGDMEVGKEISILNEPQEIIASITKAIGVTGDAEEEEIE